MPRVLLSIFLACFAPLALIAAEQSVRIDLSGSFPGADNSRPDQGTVSAPGYPQLPVRTVNILLPSGAGDVQFSYTFSDEQSVAAPAPAINPPFSDGEHILSAPARDDVRRQVRFMGVNHWGDLAYASFQVLPAVYADGVWRCFGAVEISVRYPEGDVSAPNRIPPILEPLRSAEQANLAEYFANPADLDRWYAPARSRGYDYLIVGTPSMYAAIAPLVSFHESQGFVTSFSAIADILANTPGSNNALKLRNYLVEQYNTSPFTYLLLLGDQDVVPAMLLTPEPNGTATVPSDFFYGDLSSTVDTDGDGKLGEYSSGAGLQDYLCDFTPEVFVGRISTNDAAIAAQIANRTVAYEQSSDAWKHKALLPAAWLNYAGEPLPIYNPTDGATFMQYAKQTALADRQCTSMYEQTGYVPSYPSDYALNYNTLHTLLSTESFGLLNWSAHGSAVSSSRKIWAADTNGNHLPDGSEMSWQGMVDRTSFDGLTNQDGTVIFAASCYNGQIDYSGGACLAEYALQKKAVDVIAATRTGWYKLGWKNPGYGGLSSYNLHWLENMARNNLSVGAAHAYANLTHTQYYLFGDPVDDGGIIWPELMNVYTYLLFGDPAVGHVGTQTPPLGEILVYEPTRHNGLQVVEALNSLGRFNVVYTDKIIPDYSYINGLDAIFCLFGWGADAYVPSPDSLDYSLLNSYLEQGGKVWLEGGLQWNPTDPLLSRFGVSSLPGIQAWIEAIGCEYQGGHPLWQYDQSAAETSVLQPASAGTEALFSTSNLSHANHPLAFIRHSRNGITVASAFSLTKLLSAGYDLEDMLGVVLDTLDVQAQPSVGSPEPVLYLNTPPTLNFGTVDLGDGSDYQAVTFSNSGDADLEVTELHFSGAVQDYELSETFSPFTLHPGETDSLLVRFVPHAAGSSSAQFFITNNSVNLPLLRITLQGTGQIVAPLPPQDIIISTDGTDVHLSWSPVTLNVNGNPITPDRYVIWFTNDPGSEYTYHGFTQATQYLHPYAAVVERMLFYKVFAIKNTGR
jgi:hypothetical protein